jgi:hypothetical protein
MRFANRKRPRHCKLSRAFYCERSRRDSDLYHRGLATPGDAMVDSSIVVTVSGGNTIERVAPRRGSRQRLPFRKISPARVAKPRATVSAPIRDGDLDRPLNQVSWDPP